MEDRRFFVLVAAGTAFAIAGIITHNNPANHQSATAAPSVALPSTQPAAGDLSFPPLLARELVATTKGKTSEQIGSLSIPDAMDVLRSPAHHTLADNCRARRLAFGFFLAQWATMDSEQKRSIIGIADLGGGADLSETCAQALADE